MTDAGIAEVIVEVRGRTESSLARPVVFVRGLGRAFFYLSISI